MAKEVKWDSLTPTEAETLAALVNSGKEVFAAPIEIEHSEQLESLGITWAECRTWHIGSSQVAVHLTPADEATYKILLNDLRAKHREEYRRKRCQIPGKLKPLITCPECNRCAECPYPDYRDQHKANNLSWEGMIESGYEAAHSIDDIRQAEVRMELDAVCRELDKKNPKISRAIILKEYYGFSVPEIAEKLNETERGVYYLLAEAKRIGKQYRKNNR